MAKGQIDAKFLDGLMFHSAEPKKIKKDGKEKQVWFPTERKLTPNDVLAWADKGETVVIVTADGQKHVVEKNPKKKEPEKNGDSKEKK
jgi:urease accessory protein UreE